MHTVVFSETPAAWPKSSEQCHDANLKSIRKVKNSNSLTTSLEHWSFIFGSMGQLRKIYCIQYTASDQSKRIDRRNTKEVDSENFDISTENFMN